MANFDELISRLHADYPEEQLRGKAFERVCKWFLTEDPYYGQEFRNVWLWDEWPGRWGPDIGIDLVAETATGNLVAVQAKCHTDTVPSKEIDSFISASSRPEFTQRLLIATSDITSHSETKLTHQDKPSPFLLGFSLRERPVDWLASIDVTRPARPQPKTPFPWQQTIIDDVVRGFDRADRGKAIMACGTGKTLVGLWSAEALDSQRTLVLVPSLSLVEQVSREWLENASTPFRSLFICSDETAASDAFVGQTEELGVLVTTAPEDIRDFLVGDGRRVVFSTYQSSPRLTEAQAAGAPGFDLTIADEAHHCASTTSKKDSHFRTVLDGERLRSDKRLFMTATPRIVTKRIKDMAGELDFEVASMDDEADFGPDFHVLTFGEAIAGDLLSDYRVVIIGVSEADTKNLIDNRQLVELEKTGFRADAETLAVMAGLVKTINERHLTHIITYHNRISEAADFSNGLSSLLDVLPGEQGLAQQHWSRHISGKMPTAERTTLLRGFTNLPDYQVGILSNARCLNEGVDVRAIDGIAFIQPRRSKIDIVQAVGRALRKDRNNKVATITIPIFIEDGEDADTALSSSRFEPVWAVLQALREHDDILAEELDTLRFELGRGGGTAGRLPDKIVIDMPTTVDDKFLRALETRIVETTTASWEFWFGLLVAYKVAHGDCNVKAEHKTDDGYLLGAWVSNQRYVYRTGKLSDERVARLRELGLVWGVHESAWEEGYQHLVAYKAAHGDCNVAKRHKTDDGYKLGSWVTERRKAYVRHQMSDERTARLEALGFVWIPYEAAWEEDYQRLVAYKAAHGDCNVNTRHETDDGYALGHWVGIQRKAYVRHQMSDERIARLEQLGFVWDVLEAAWEEGYQHLVAYKAAHGDCNVEQRHKTDDGYPLGFWVLSQRHRYVAGQLSDERTSRLRELGFVWNILEAAWEEGYQHLVAYKAAHGDCIVARNHKTDEGYSLAQWVSHQRRDQAAGKLSEERAARLKKLGFVWNILEAAWDKGYQHLVAYKAAHGDCIVNARHKTDDGYALGGWVSKQRKGYAAGKLSDERTARLTELGFVWDVLEAAWEEGYQHLVAYKAAHGDCNVARRHKTDDGYALGGWVSTQRMGYAAGKLSDEHITRLKKLEFVWRLK